MIKSIAIVEKVKRYDLLKEEKHISKKGVILVEIEGVKGFKLLDLESMRDITDSEIIKINILPKKSKLKYLFKNICV